MGKVWSFPSAPATFVFGHVLPPVRLFFILSGRLPDRLPAFGDGAGPDGEETRRRADGVAVGELGERGIDRFEAAFVEQGPSRLVAQKDFKMGGGRGGITMGERRGFDICA